MLRSLLENLSANIQRIEQIMTEVATGEARIQEREEEYKQLYFEISATIENLQEEGYRFLNPNTFTSLWDWYGHWSTNLRSYQSRRVYVKDLYKDLVEPLESVLRKNIPSVNAETDLARELRQRLERIRLAAVTSHFPPEIQDSLRKFQKDHPDPTKAAFIMMKFSNTPIHEGIANTIKATLHEFGLTGLRADDKQYHDDLFPNVLTYIYGCGFGIAVFERIEADEFNPNVALEVGYMLALRKDVCFLKERTLRTLHTDLIGKLYKSFDTFELDTISNELKRWLTDKNLV